MATAPDGISVYPLVSHKDDRGTFTELYRDEWALSAGLERWELVELEADASRPLDASLLVVLDGQVRLELDGVAVVLAGARPAIVTVAAPASAVIRTADGPALVARAST